MQVFLGECLQGVTKADSGEIVVEDVPAGQHTIKMVKPGSNPQQDGMRVDAGQVFENRVPPFRPQLGDFQREESSQQQVGQRAGELLVQSLPGPCTLTIPALGLSDKKRSKTEWLVHKVPTGTYTATMREFAR